MPYARRWVPLVLAVLGIAPAGAQAPADDALARILKLPVSPGAVAMLLPLAGQPAAYERLAQAVADPSPEVRAVAARVAFTTRHAALAPALSAALEKEAHPVAGAEIVRALSLIRGAAADPLIAAALARLDARAGLAWAEMVGRTRAAALFDQLATLPDSDDVGRALGAAAGRHPEAAAKAFAALPATPQILPAYLALVSWARRPQAEVPPWPVLSAGLATPGRARLATLLLLVDARAGGRRLPPEAETVLREMVSGSEATPAAHVYAELVARRPKMPGRSLAAQIARIETQAVPGRFFYEPVFEKVTAEEAEAIARIVPGWVPPDRPTSGRGPAEPPAAPVEEPGDSMTRLPRPLSTALLKDLHHITGCRPTPGPFAVLDVRYRATGQVRGVALVDQVDAACAQFASLLGALEVPPGALPVAEARVDRVVVGLRPSDLECEREPADLQLPPVRIGATVTAPVKTRNVAPVYPPAAIERRIQGVVLVEAVVPRTGCVADAFVTRRVDPAVDVSALAAVGEWRYKPALLDGQPVPVIMTVTVRFSLQ